MNKINFRFLNYKHYASFKNDLDSGKILNDSIVFIQDKKSIWARGKEYICDGPYTAAVSNNVLTFKNGTDSLRFKLSQKNGTIEFEDAEGNKSSATYVLDGNFKNQIQQINNTITNIQQIAQGYALEGDLADVAFSGDYNDLINTPDPITIDEYLDPDSLNPVQNKEIYTRLLSKADSSALNEYVRTSVYTTEMAGKQDTLYEDYGIDIFKDPVSNRTKIKSTLDVDVYEFVTTLPSTSDANSNKIYILEVNNGDLTYRYEQYRLRNGSWVSFGMVAPQVNLSEYLKSAIADEKYQPIGTYVSEDGLAPYAKIEEHINPILAALNGYALKSYVDSNFLPSGDYATKDWVKTYFVQKLQVYYPKQGEWGTDTPSEGGQSNPTIVLQIVVDRFLDPTSRNPVQNSTVTLAILDLRNNKADKSQLDGYATKTDLDSKVDVGVLGSYIKRGDVSDIINGKQDILIPGRGIAITNNEISCTLDTEVYVFVKDTLPSPLNASANKIYILETTNGNQREYTQWRWDADQNDWVQIGDITPEIDLTDYLTREEANRSYAPKGSYATLTLLQTLRTDAYRDLLPAGNYATVDGVNSLLNNSGYITSSDLLPYAFKLDLEDLETALRDYATKQDLEDLSDLIEEIYVKQAHVYTPQSGWTSGGSSSTGGSSSQLGGENATIVYNIEVDRALSTTSSNPVANWRVTKELAKKLENKDLQDYAKATELNQKADISFVTENYVNNNAFNNAINGKLDKLTVGDGISIDDNGVISATLDTNPIVFVNGDLPTQNISENKIYLQEVEVDGTVVYRQWRRKNNSWVNMGAVDFDIDLSGYLTEDQADSKYLIPDGTYLTPLQADTVYQRKPNTSRFALISEIESGYQEKGDYVESEDFDALRTYVDNTFQKKGESDDPVYESHNMVTLTVALYEALVRNNLVLLNTYYFTYEEEETSSWGFGDQFPVILTDGSTPDSIGTFPINLV